MKKSIQTVGILSLIASGLSFSGQASAASSACAAYGPVQPGVNPSFQHINCLLTEEALEHEIPPEVVKAIATQENGGWKQFDEDGQAIVSPDGGIGLMQLTNQADLSPERLKTDIVYNIESGVAVLDKMYDRNLPKIADADRNVIENWYFPVMAYNGIKPVNSPVEQSTGEKNLDAYQERVFAEIERWSYMNDTDLADLGFKAEDFQYDPGSTDNIVFKKMSYSPALSMHKTAYMFQKGDQVMTTGSSNLRNIPGGGTGDILTNLPEGTVLTVTGPFQFDQNPKINRQFVWYPVKTTAGKTGFVSSAYVEKTDKPPTPTVSFKDVPASHRFYNDIAALSNQGVISGFKDGSFGPNKQVTRGETAIMIVRALDLSTAGKTPVEIVQEKRIMGGYPGGQFGADKPITRAEMAIVLTNAFDLKEVAAVSFTDVHSGMKAYDSIKRVVAAEITYGVDKNHFKPNAAVTRGQISAFIHRALQR